MAEKQSDGVQQVNSVRHAVQILELFAQCHCDAMSLTEISRSLGMHKTTVYRILRTLQAAGWIQQQSANGLYQLGSGILPVASAAAQNHSVQSIIAEEMARLCETFQELVVLATVQDGAGVCANLVKSQRNPSLRTAVGYPVPLGVGATGKMLLAVQPKALIQRVADSLPPERSAALLHQMAQIQQQGYCYTESEVDLGAAALAVPLLCQNDTYVLSISGPVERLHKLGQEPLRQALRQATQRIYQKLQAASIYGTAPAAKKNEK